MEQTEKLQKKIFNKIPKQYKDTVLRAITFAQKIHKQDLRYNQEPLINHLLKIALLSVENNLDVNSTISAILHQIPLEEENIEYIKNNFDSNILKILQKIEKIRESTNAPDTPNEIIIKYILNSSHDLRPVLIKILDTLEDMRSIEYVPEEERKRSLFKALNIYSVLAEYVNWEKIKKEIDENAFREYLPIEYESITKKMEEEDVNDDILNKYRIKIEQKLKEIDIPIRIEGRIKSKYSIYNKLKKYEKEWKNPNIGAINDIVAFRLITDTEESCYLILEKIMDKLELDYEKLDDYISHPKPNGYQSIHTYCIVNEISQKDIEIQILTEDMYYFNTYGPASHIAYKASRSRYAKPSNKYNWVEDIHKQINISTKERGRNIDIPIRCKIFEDEVLVFTPKGKIIDLDKKDTVLDFAFKLHTEIGNKAVSAEVNGKPTKLSSNLKTGDIIEIKIDKNKRCQKIEALHHVNSTSSKFKIRKELLKNSNK